MPSPVVSSPELGDVSVDVLLVDSVELVDVESGGRPASSSELTLGSVVTEVDSPVLVLDVLVAARGCVDR